MVLIYHFPTSFSHSSITFSHWCVGSRRRKTSLLDYFRLLCMYYMFYRWLFLKEKDIDLKRVEDIGWEEKGKKDREKYREIKNKAEAKAYNIKWCVEALSLTSRISKMQKKMKAKTTILLPKFTRKNPNFFGLKFLWKNNFRRSFLWHIFDKKHRKNLFIMGFEKNYHIKSQKKLSIKFNFCAKFQKLITGSYCLIYSEPSQKRRFLSIGYSMKSFQEDFWNFVCWKIGIKSIGCVNNSHAKHSNTDSHPRSWIFLNFFCVIYFSCEVTDKIWRV